MTAKRAVLAASVLLAAALPASEWGWGVPADLYRDLDFSIRAGVDRAVKIFQLAENAERSGKPVRDLVPMYRGAAGEWKKVQVQCESEDFSEGILACVVFMQGYSYDRAHDRNEAIKMYTEVLDLYPDEVYSAVSAKWKMAQIYLGMGDTRKGNEIGDEICEDKRPQALKHPLMAEALMNRARRLWNAGNEDEAGVIWDQVIANKAFHKNARREVEEAKNMFRFLCFVSMDFARLEAMLFDGIDEKLTSKMADQIIGQFSWAMGEYGNRGSATRSYFGRTIKKEKELDAKMKKFFTAYLKWGESKKPIFEACNRKFDFDMMLFKAWYNVETKDQIKARFYKLLNEVQADSDKNRMLSRLFIIAGVLMDLGDFATARIVADKIPDPKRRLWYVYGIESRLRRWKEMYDILDQIAALKPQPDAGEMTDIKWKKVDCLENMGKLEEEVKLLNDISDPPRTLWRLQSVHRKMGNKTKSYAVLNEIMFFPKDAPQSVLVQAQYREADGQKDQAIALYRRLLSQPEWKQTSQSSAAHQALERYGIATGGAMINTVR